jgi:leader peptidase (prepilin peptidase)/N-methyltransferase
VATGPTAIAGAVFGWLLLAVAAIDAVSYRIPNLLNFAIAVLGLVAGAAGLAPAFDDRLIGGVAGFAALWLVSAGYRYSRGRTGLGGGDVKLLGAIGLWLGWRALPWVVLIACIIGLAWALLRRLKSGDRLPFGTLLAAGAFAAWIAGRTVFPTP